MFREEGCITIRGGGFWGGSNAIYLYEKRENTYEEVRITELLSFSLKDNEKKRKARCATLKNNSALRKKGWTVGRKNPSSWGVD